MQKELLKLKEEDQTSDRLKKAGGDFRVNGRRDLESPETLQKH